MKTGPFEQPYSTIQKVAVMVLLGLLMAGCGPTSAEMDLNEETLGLDFTPAPFPDNLGIPGFTFPEQKATLDNWVSSNDLDAIYLHGWGLWAGLTADSGQTFEDQPLRVFETWYTPEEILCITGLNPDDCPTAQRVPNPLGDLHQLTANDQSQADDESAVEGFVKYDPTASNHIIQEQLFNKTHLQALLDAGEKKIPDFPNTAISLKPVFIQFDCDTECKEPLVRIADEGRYAQISVWAGSEQSCAAPGSCFPENPNPKGFPEKDWPDCVWVDTQNGSDGAAAAPTDCSSDAVQTAYNINDFIWFQDTSTNVYAILVGMHVTSREINRWTWQSFWWSPTPDTPNHPSSQAIAAARPSELPAPSNHYAMSIGYSMVTPAQPETGGQSVGESIYSFNPYLEAGFGTDSVPLPIVGDYTYEGIKVANNVGVETNCMSCHIQATLSGNLQYSGDQYIDMQAPEFDNELTLDFLWSIQANAVAPPQ